MPDLDLPHESVEVVIMSPPFTRPTNHESAEAPVPSFAGFEESEAEQRAMAGIQRAVREAIREPAGHGNASLASNFIDVAQAKVKPGGGVVLPLAYAQGGGWARAAADEPALPRRDCGGDEAGPAFARRGTDSVCEPTLPTCQRLQDAQFDEYL